MKRKRYGILTIVLALTIIGGIYLSNISSNATNTVIKKLAGSDRYATAVELSKKQFTTSNVACIVNGNALPDGLTITPLATYYKAPILLSRLNELPQTTKDEIKRLKVTKVFIGGSEGVVSEKVVKELKSLGVKEVIRLGGKDRYDTALEIAKYLDANCFPVKEIVVAYGIGEPDSLSIASVAGSKQMAIILTPKDNLKQNVYDWLKSKNLTNAYIIGSDGVVSNQVMNKINSITSQDISNNRLGGKDRYETNAKVIERFFPNDLSEAYVSKGWDGYLIDALSSGVISALNNAPVILLNTNSTVNSMQEKVLSHKNSMVLYEVGGGLNQVAVKKVADLLGSNTIPETPQSNLSISEIEKKLTSLGYAFDEESSGYGIRVYNSSTMGNTIAIADNKSIEISLTGKFGGKELNEKDKSNVKTILNWIFKTNGNDVYNKFINKFNDHTLTVEGKSVELWNADVPIIKIRY